MGNDNEKSVSSLDNQSPRRSISTTVSIPVQSPPTSHYSSPDQSPRPKSISRSITPGQSPPKSHFKFLNTETSSDNKTKLKFGLKRSKPDERDKFVSFFNYEKVPLPLQFCLENYEIFDQGNMNSCSANSVSNQIKLSCDKLPSNIIPSRLYIYINSRLEDAEENQQLYIGDEGASLKNCYTALLKYNYVDEKHYPYCEENVNVFPPKSLYNIAFSNHKVLESYRKVLLIEYNLKYILYKVKKPIVLGMAVYENFERITKTNNILMKPAPCDQFLGAHACLCIGFNDINRTFTILNSHGKDWGNNGLFQMSHEYIFNNNLVFESWVVNS